MQKKDWFPVILGNILNRNRTMKLSFVLLVFALLNVQANSFSQNAKINLNIENGTIQEVLEEIESKSEFRFFYRSGEIDDNRKVSLSVKNKKISYILDLIFKDRPVTYSLVDNQIVLKRTLDGINKNKEPAQIPEKSPPPLVSVQQTVSGTITDNQGIPVPGANVVEKGTTNGVAADFDGNYSITVSGPESVLTFSSIGFAPQEIPVGQSTNIDVVLKVDSQALDEVIVTALGIKKEEKTLGYSTVVVDNEELTENRTSSTMGTLQGKMSGVNITSLATGPQGSTRIRIRGNSSFSGANTPLIVINGVPVDNTQFDGEGLSNADGGDGLSSVNADDIESMTVLKGAAAAALYGSRAKDGVVMITTKQGSKGAGFSVEFNSNITTDTPLDQTDFQYEYGQGERGIRPTSAFPTSGIWSFGEKFEPGMTQVLFDNVVVPYVPQRNHIKDFYRTGTNVTHTLSLSNGSESGSFNVSFSNTDNTSIVPNSDFNRKTINLGFVQNITEELSVQGNVNYSNEYNHNPAQVGGQEFSTASAVLTAANSMPFDLLQENSVDEQGNEVVWARFLPRTNPYFSAYQHFENVKRDRYFGNISLKYQFTDWLYMQGRIAQDHYVRNQDYNYPTGYAAIGPAPSGYVNGSYFRNQRQFRERNYDFLIGAAGDISENFGLDITLGGNQMYRRVEDNRASAQDFIERGLYTIMNGRIKTANHSLSERQVNSLYGAAQVSYKDYLFLNVTGRNDWFSTLAPGNRSIFYPSITSSFVFSDAFDNLPEWLTFGKLRLGYAEVGDDNVAPYSQSLYYEVNNNLYPSPSESQSPVGGISGSTIPNGNLRPLRVSEIEAGIDLRMFNNRFGFDLTAYRKISEDQIVSAQVSNTTSYTSQLINVGRSMNKGLEVAVRGTPIMTDSFRWSIDANISYITSEVLQLGLSEDDDQITIGGVRQVVGKPLNQVYSYMYLRDEQGRQVFDENSGFPLRTPEQVNVGTNLPEYFGGITNTFRYKNFTLSTLIDFKLGKDFITVSGANRNFWRHGLHKGTLPGRDVGYVIGDGVNLDGGVNQTRADIQPFYESPHVQAILEPWIYNAGFWKLRQVTLSYDFTDNLPENSFIQGLRLSLVSNNVAVLKKHTENVDPEQAASYSDTAYESWPTLPLTRSLGFNLNVKF